MTTELPITLPRPCGQNTPHPAHDYNDAWPKAGVNPGWEYGVRHCAGVNPEPKHIAEEFYLRWIPEFGEPEDIDLGEPCLRNGLDGRFELRTRRVSDGD